MHGLPSLPGSAARVESPLTPLFRAPLAIELARGARGKIEDGRAGNGKRGRFPIGTPAPAPRAGLPLELGAYGACGLDVCSGMDSGLAYCPQLCKKDQW